MATIVHINAERTGAALCCNTFKWNNEEVG